jgi:hypothetical protein
MFIFLDTETTGTGPEDRLCQIAFKPEGGPAVCETFNSGMPISIEAMSIHLMLSRWQESNRSKFLKYYFKGLQNLYGGESAVNVRETAARSSRRSG